MSILVVTIQIGGRIYRERQAREEELEFSALISRTLLALLLTSLVLAVLNIYFALFWIFMVNLLIYLVIGILIFMNLLRDQEAGA